MEVERWRECNEMVDRRRPKSNNIRGLFKRYTNGMDINKKRRTSSMKYLRIGKIEEFIEILKNAKTTNCRYAEQQRIHAIACLENYRAELDTMGIKTVKIGKEE